MNTIDVSMKLQYELTNFGVANHYHSIMEMCQNLYSHGTVSIHSLKSGTYMREIQGEMGKMSDTDSLIGTLC